MAPGSLLGLAPYWAGLCSFRDQTGSHQSDDEERGGFIPPQLEESTPSELTIQVHQGRECLLHLAKFRWLLGGMDARVEHQTDDFCM